MIGDGLKETKAIVQTQRIKRKARTPNRTIAARLIQVLADIAETTPKTKDKFAAVALIRLIQGKNTGMDKLPKTLKPKDKTLRSLFDMVKPDDKSEPV